MTDRDSEFTAYYAACGPSLRRMAYLLCGSWHQAEDLTQTVFIKLYRAWPRIAKRDSMDAYTRRALVRVFLDEQRRPESRRHPGPAVPGAARSHIPARSVPHRPHARTGPRPLPGLHRHRQRRHRQPRTLTRVSVRHPHDGDWTIVVLHSGGLFPDETVKQIILNPAFAP